MGKNEKIINPYGALKAARHPNKILELRQGKQPYPVHVQLIISDYCNQYCNFCAYRTKGYSSSELFGEKDLGGEVNRNPKRMIPPEKIWEIISDCKEMGVKAIQLTGGGEPTVHPNFDEVCAGVFEAGIDLAVVTNGLLIRPKTRRLELLARSCWTRISVDCGSAETYARIRGVPAKELEVVGNNVASLAVFPGRRCLLGIGFVVTKNNYREIASGCELFKSWGVDNVRISALFQNDEVHYFEGLLDEIVGQIVEAKTLEDSNFRVIDNFGVRFADLAVGSPDYSLCGFMHLGTYIGGDQNVYTCCMNAYSQRGLIGSIKERSFKALWDSQLKQEFYEVFDPRKCVRCMYNDKNRAVVDLVEPPRDHDCFI